MGDLRVNVITILTIAVISTLGVKTTNVVWDKFVAPKINKK